MNTLVVCFAAARRRLSHARLLLACGTLLVLVGTLASGCAPIGAAAYYIAGPPKEDAAYKPGKLPVLVMVENYNEGGLDAPSDELAAYITTQLVANKAGDVVYPQQLLNLRAAKGEEEFHQMKIPDVGKALGAGQVLYVNLRRLDITSPPSSDIIECKVAANVKVVRVADGKTLWPVGSSEGFPVPASPAIVRRDAHVNEDAVRTQVLQDLAEQIAKQFYDYKPDFDKVGDE